MKRMFTGTKMSDRALRRLPKILLHEHLDCSLRFRTILELWSQRGFDKAVFPFPPEVQALWNGTNIDPKLAGRARSAALKASRNQACRVYEKWLVAFGASSLDNYIGAIRDHIVPIMQTAENIERIARERIEDAVKDGIIGLELRFAPQFHVFEGLTLDDVVQAVIKAVKDAPIPVELTICCARHEDGPKSRPLGDLAVKYHRHVGCQDLACSEGMFPGVLEWFVNEAVRARALRRLRGLRPLIIKCHLGETNSLTELDNDKLNHPEKYVSEEVLAELGVERDHPCLQGAIEIEGHGIRDLDSDRVREVCPTSNVVTGQVESIEAHNIDALYRAGKPVTVNTDGLTLTGLTGLTDEYANLQRAFGWTKADFYRVNLTALDASSFSTRKKAALKRQLKQSYC